MQRTPCSREVLAASRPRRPGSAPRTTSSADATSPSGRSSSTSAASVRASSSTRWPSAASRSASRAHGIVGVAVDPHHLRRAEHPRAPVAERRRAPLAARRERRRAGALPTVGRGERLAQRVHRRVAVVVVGERAERVGHGIVGRDLVHLLEPDRALGERARLVEQDDVDAGEALDRGQLLHEHLAARERDRGDAEREARQQHEPFGHHRDDPGDDSRDRGAVRVLHVELAEREQHRGREQRPLHVAQDPVDAVHRARSG